ncbi:MAG: hypothetical protein CALGDGBN_01927 [Pseudomonadales bacterium]|nr:hypothetical protein [Pseudomonadales bacterium]
MRIVRASLPISPSPSLPSSVTVNVSVYSPASAAVGVHSNTTVPYCTPGVSVAPGGNASALNTSVSWSRSEARIVKRSSSPKTATLSPIGASTGASEGDSAVITKV